MDEWKEAVWLAVGAFVTAMLITFVVVMSSEVRQVARLQQQDIDAVAVLEEHRKWVKYDNVLVNQADVINCVLENRAQAPTVAATANPASDNPNAPFVYDYTWTSSSDYSMNALNVRIPPGSRYRAQLIKDANGAILYIWFRRIV